MVIVMKEFFGNIKLEWKKITWPTDKELKLGVAQVFTFMVTLAIFFAVVDAIIGNSISFLAR